MSIYLDTSALVKLLVDEDGSDLARSEYAEANRPRTTAIAYVEATSAVMRMRKGKRLSAAELRIALGELDTVWAALDVLDVSDALIQAAAKTARDHELRAYDAVHLAGALAFAEGEEIAFACWDNELSEAASEHGFALIPERRTPAPAEQVLRAAYAAFNERDLDAATALMHPDVDWPNAWEGGRVQGRDRVRRYWEHQFEAISSQVEPKRFSEEADGSIVAEVHQVVRDAGTGELISDAHVRHRYRLDRGQVVRMDVIEA